MALTDVIDKENRAKLMRKEKLVLVRGMPSNSNTDKFLVRLPDNKITPPCALNEFLSEAELKAAYRNYHDAKLEGDKHYFRLDIERLATVLKKTIEVCTTNNGDYSQLTKREEYKPETQ